MRLRFPQRLLVALVVALGIATLQPAKAADDPLGNRQWGLIQVHAPAAWSVSTGEGVKIGIVDSGVNRNHEDLVGKVIASATCVDTTNRGAAGCTSGPGDGNDINGHGTHVAGIAAAITGNGTGIAGVAPNAKLIVARAFKPSSDPSQEPTADLNDVKAAIDWVVKQGAQIVNLSVGVESSGVCLLCNNTSNPLGPAVEKAWTDGALPIIASGNSNQQLFGGGPGYAKLDAIVVGATGPDGTVEPYSSAIGSAKWGIVAPGGDATGTGDPACNDPNSTSCGMVLSTYKDTSSCQPNRCYAYLSGTSMATPHVSGAAALLFAHGLSRQEVVDTLLAAADPIDCGTNCAGRLNVARALGTVPNDTGNGGSNTTHPPTTKKPSSGGGTAKGGGTTSTTPTTSPFTFNSEKSSSTTVRNPRNAIVLQSSPREDKSVPVTVGLAGIVSLAVAALAMSYNLRKTLTTLP